jgi:hypothetical protein
VFDKRHVDRLGHRIVQSRWRASVMKRRKRIERVREGRGWKVPGMIQVVRGQRYHAVREQFFCERYECVSGVEALYNDRKREISYRIRKGSKEAVVKYV